MTQRKTALLIIAVLILALFAWTFAHCAPFDKCPWSRNMDSNREKQVTLTFYGARDTEDDWYDIINKFEDYEKKTRGMKVYVNYKQLDQYNYQDLIYDSLVNKKGPNIFMMFNRWLPTYQARIVPLPETIMTMDDFEKHFVPVTKQDLTSKGKIYSLPLYVDTLGLFYNKTMFYNKGVVQPPADWKQFLKAVEDVTKLDNNGHLLINGAAIGGSKYTNRSQDVLMLLVMQNNSNSDKAKENPVSFSTEEAIGAIAQYAGFSNKANRYYTWDYNSQIYSIDAFIEGKAAMSINYSYEIENIDSKTQGALDYGTAPVPQKNADNKINYANYWSPVVAKGADCVKEKGVTVSCEELAWDFVSFAAMPENARLYLEETNRPAAEVSLIEEQMGEVGSKLAPFAQQALTARSWNEPNNKESDEVLVNMIEYLITPDKNKKKTVQEARDWAVDRIKTLE